MVSNRGIKLKCQRCKRIWTYKGDRKFYATCPDCKSSVKIPRNKED